MNKYLKNLLSIEKEKEYALTCLLKNLVEAAFFIWSGKLWSIIAALQLKDGRWQNRNEECEAKVGLFPCEQRFYSAKIIS